MGCAEGTSGQPLRRAALPDADAGGRPRRQSRWSRSSNGAAGRAGGRRYRATRLGPSEHDGPLPLVDAQTHAVGDNAVRGVAPEHPQSVAALRRPPGSPAYRASSAMVWRVLVSPATSTLQTIAELAL